MKLPDDKTEKMKILVLIAIGVAGVLYGIVAGIIMPIKTKTRAQGEKIEKLESELRKADLLISQIRKDGWDSYESILAIRSIMEKNSLRFRLGDYLLDATEILDEHAKTAGVELTAVRKVATTEIPVGKEKTPGTLKLFTVAASLECGLRELEVFLRETEKKNPYVSILSLTVATLRDSPIKHDIVVTIAWPIWSSPDTAESLQKQLNAAETRFGKASAESKAKKNK